MFFIVPGQVKTKSRTLKIMHKILWQWKRNQLQNMWVLIYRGCLILPQIWHMHRKSQVLYSQKWFRQGLFTLKQTGFELQFLCCGGHLRKQMYAFSRLPLCSLKGCRKEVSCVAILTNLKNELNRLKQQEERICGLDTVWMFKWKEVNWTLKVYIII